MGFVTCIFYFIKSEIFDNIIFTPVSMILKTGNYAKLEELENLLEELIDKSSEVVDLKKIQKKLEMHPWVSFTAVKFLVSENMGNLEIEISERIPMAICELDEMWVVDSFGIPFKQVDNDWESMLPFIDRKDAVEILKNYEYINKPLGQIVEIHEQFTDQYQVKFINGLEVSMTMEDNLEQFEKLVFILEFLKDKRNDLIFIHLDYALNKNRIIARFRNGAI